MGNNGKLEAERYAVVTGANKGIGFEIARQLASKGVTVVLTARDEVRGNEATAKLHRLLFSDAVFHQLDVLDQTSIDALARFISQRFGRLDILVNNAGVSGAIVDEDSPKALGILSGKVAKVIQSVVKYIYEEAQVCLNTNYYGVQRVTEILLPLLQLSSTGARIVYVSSLRSELKRNPAESIRNELRDIENQTEEKLDSTLQRFLKDFKENALEANGWPTMLPAYSISKAVLNAYTRILARKYPNMHINCVRPVYVNTDINWHTGVITTEEGAKDPVKCALILDGGPTGCYFDQTEVAEF
ncbi:Salutaridine reductase [Hibiscus syriacus]|uniref:Salutaridine reductase n=2 Tax=Hibiscus syriacus TaxID=106335 RepID=A0A6A3B320_HIBSY|nr:Salutaridine reductase [Hibiscus syriacus]